jgi:hypothetical protein
MYPLGRAVIIKRTLDRAATQRSPHWRPIFSKRGNIQISGHFEFTVFFTITARPGGMYVNNQR